MICSFLLLHLCDLLYFVYFHRMRFKKINMVIFVMEEKENIVRKRRKRLLDYKTTIGLLNDEMVAKDRVLVEIRKKLDWCESLNHELKGAFFSCFFNLNLMSQVGW